MFITQTGQFVNPVSFSPSLWHQTYLLAFHNLSSQEHQQPRSLFVILGDPEADSQGKRQIKLVKSARAEAWCERKFIRSAKKSSWEDNFNGLVQEPVKSPFAFLLLIEQNF